MPPIAGYGFSIVVISMIVLIYLKIKRDGLDSALESAFESNRQKARILIEIYQKWMVIVFIPVVVGLLLIIGGAIYGAWTGQAVVCR